jgi:hypothetical protein
MDFEIYADEIGLEALKNKEVHTYCQAKRIFQNRRVAIVKGNYVVIISFTGLLKAKLVSAYEKIDITNILSSPDFEKSTQFFGDKA